VSEVFSESFRLASGNKMSLDFTQIYFQDDQLKELYSFAHPYRNEVVTDFFENEVIAKRVPLSDAEYIGVCSWRLREKRQSGKCPMILGIYGKDDLSEEKILNSNADIINLRPFSSSHQMMTCAAAWHGGAQHNYAWDNAIGELGKFISIPEEVKTPIYENAFVAKRDIYHSYVNTFLSPVMEFMRSSACFFVDSGYAEKKERDPNGGKEAVERYRKETGRNDWPIAPFVLERLFSIWINDKQFNVVNL
jgi:hypothetical protein